MAQWKKIVVSGSDISQLNNDSNFVTSTSGGIVTLSGSFSGSYEGNGSGLTDINYTNIVNQPTLVSGSAQIDITGTTGYTTFSSSIATDLTALEDTTVTGGDGITTSGTLGSGVTVTANVDNTTIEVSGDNLQVKGNGIGATQLDNVFTTGGGVAGGFGSSTQVPVLNIDEQGRITSASLSTISTTLGISGDTGTDSVSLIDGTLDFEGTNGITTTVSDDKVTFALNSGVVSGSTFTSPNQGTLRSTLNGVASDIDLGLQTTDNVTFGSLVVTNDTTIDGNLTVNGDLTTLNTTNKAIKDKFILLNSGSTNPDEGGLVIDEGNGTGHAFLYDGDDGRWGVTATLNATASAADNEAYVALVVHEDDVNHDVNDAEYAKVGNIKVDSSGNIFMYT